MRSLRLLFAAALLAVGVPTAHAQLLPSFGVAGGLNFAGLTDAASFDTGQSTGFHIGGYGQMGVGPLAVRTSLLFVSGGRIEARQPTAGEAFERLNVSFIALPVDLQYRMGGIPLFSPYLLAGPEARFALGDLLDADARGVALGANVGAGTELGFFIGPRVWAELRYGFDVTGFFDDGVAGVPASENESVRVSLFFVRVGVGI